MEAKKNLLIIGWFKFPFGSAAASRIRTLAKGLIEQNVTVHVITTARLPFRIEDQQSTGQMFWEGIQYESGNQYEQAGQDLSLCERLLNYIKAIIKSWIRVLKLVRHGKFQNILIYGRSAVSYFPIVLIARLYGIALFFDMVEWFPPEKFKGGRINPCFYDDWLGRHLPLLGCQSVIAISTYISSQYTRFNIPCLIVPSIFDDSFYSSVAFSKIETGSEKFITLYAGTCKYGDGFDQLLDAVKIAFSQGCPIYLYVLGTEGLSGNARQKRKTCEEDDILSSCVCFLGKVSDQKYFEILVSANCLVLPRPDLQVTKAAFPTRLPEFLSTGRPVLTTSVPDIPKYLEAGIHAEIVSEDSSQALAKGLLKLWRNPERARKIGLAGQQRSREVFNYRQYTENLYQLLTKPNSSTSKQ